MGEDPHHDGPRRLETARRRGGRSNAPVDGGTAAGRRRRYEKLMAANYQALLGYAARRIDPPADAADVVCDVFLVAWQKIDEVPPGRHGTLWLYGVARNVLANSNRRSRRRRLLTDKLRAQVAAVPVEPPDAIIAEPVRQALQRLSADDRELLTLTAWEGLAPAEIADVLGVDAGAVRVRLHRARRRFRQILDDDSAMQRGGGSQHMKGGRAITRLRTKEAK